MYGSLSVSCFQWISRIWYLKDFCSSLYQLFYKLLIIWAIYRHFYFILIIFGFYKFLFVDFIYFVYPCPSEASRGSILCLWILYTLFTLVLLRHQGGVSYVCGFLLLYLPFVLFRQKGGVLFLDRICIFNQLSDFCSRMVKGGV
jgi:hypothetical protein